MSQHVIKVMITAQVSIELERLSDLALMVIYNAGHKVPDIFQGPMQGLPFDLWLSLVDIEYKKRSIDCSCNKKHMACDKFAHEAKDAPTL